MTPGIRPRDLLTDAILGRLRGTEGADAATLGRDIAVLRDAGYLTVALPPGLGGLGCTLRQAACGQRRLAGRAPLTALAVSAHLYWTGAAADAHRSGDSSVRWISREAARGALFGAGHGDPGSDLKFAAPASRCDRDTPDGYQFHGTGALFSTVTPGWDWLAVHGLYVPGGTTPLSTPRLRGGDSPDTPPPGGTRTNHGPPGPAAYRAGDDPPVDPPAQRGNPPDTPRPGEPGTNRRAPGPPAYRAEETGLHEAVLAFADGGTRCTPAGYRIARVLPAGAPSDVFTSSAIGWGCGLLASVEFAAARREFRRAIGCAGDGAVSQWAVAEAGLRLDAMKARIAEVTHPWPLVREPLPDLGGQRLISLFAMRREITESSGRVRDLSKQIAGSRSSASSAISAR